VSDRIVIISERGTVETISVDNGVSYDYVNLSPAHTVIHFADVDSDIDVQPEPHDDDEIITVEADTEEVDSDAVVVTFTKEQTRYVFDLLMKTDSGTAEALGFDETVDMGAFNAVLYSDLDDLGGRDPADTIEIRVVKT